MCERLMLDQIFVVSLATDLLSLHFQSIRTRILVLKQYVGFAQSSSSSTPAVLWQQISMEELTPFQALHSGSRNPRCFESHLKSFAFRRLGICCCERFVSSDSKPAALRSFCTRRSVFWARRSSNVCSGTSKEDYEGVSSIKVHRCWRVIEGVQRFCSVLSMLMEDRIVVRLCLENRRTTSFFNNII